MAQIKLLPHQVAAVEKMKNGCILCGDVGSGKSITSLAYYTKCQGGTIDKPGSMKNPRDLYIITTARKRDTLEWDGELIHIFMSTNPEHDWYKGHKVVIDSWNNIKKYRKVNGAFFIFDEQRVVGSGVWVKSFLDIARKNRWILLSATPGDRWQDYIPVFVANGFYKNKTEFEREHAIYNRFSKFPKIDRYINEPKLERLRDSILVDMPFERKRKIHDEDVYVSYNISEYKDVSRLRWNIYKNKPIRNAAELCFVWRRIVNSDESRQMAILELFEDHPKMIVFYNYNYELDILKTIFYESGVEIAEWNGHIHDPIPTSDSWVYLVQYSAGSEGWNCTTTDTMVFYSQNYSYKVMKQASGRIDRMNSPYDTLYYYHLKSRAAIDLAINRAILEKRRFNERSFVETRK